MYYYYYFPSFQVKAIFVNIFGGIVKCDVVAEGIIAAAREMDLKLPVVIRIQGRVSPVV